MKFEEKIYYKYVTQVSGGLRSWGTKDRIFSLMYGVDRVTTTIPGSLGLFVFDTIEHAHRFFKLGTTDSMFKLYKCRVKGPVVKVIAMNDWAFPSQWLHQKRWSRERRMKMLLQNHTVNKFGPRGSYSVAAVQLLPGVIEYNHEI